MSSITGSGTLSLRDNGGTVEYNLNNTSWSAVSAWPIIIVNDGINTLKVLFTTDITLTTSSQYFICGSDSIQFGDTVLNADGSRPIIAINGVGSYPGLIQNGTDVTNGYTNISIYNLNIVSLTSSLLNNGGWIGQTRFANGATDIVPEL